MGVKIARRPAIIAVHLSQRGSFLREGFLGVFGILLGIPSVAHIHGSSFAKFSADHPKLCRTVLKKMSDVIVLSEETEGSVRRVIPNLDPVRLPNAVSLGLEVDKRADVVFAGVVGTRKGVDVLLDAWSGIPPGHGKSLRILGPIEMNLDQWRGIPNVSFEGPLPHEELMNVLDRSVIAVLPSRAEALPLFILESMARGNAIIATSVGAIPDLLSDGVGIVVDPGNVEALRTALEELLFDELRTSTMGDRSRTRVGKKYSVDAVYPLVERVWSAALIRARKKEN